MSKSIPKIPANRFLYEEYIELEKKLEIAVKALEHIKRLPVRVCCDNTAEQALKEIGDVRLQRSI